MHEATMQVLRHFEYAHLPEPLREVSRPFGELAGRLVDPGPGGLGLEGPEATMALRKLLEAKDCAVRAALPR
jgi:hypothetical protein